MHINGGVKMKKRTLKNLVSTTVLAGTLVITAFGFVGCGKDSALNITDEDVALAVDEALAAHKDAFNNDTTEVPTSNFATYANSDGWSVQYDSNLVEVTESDDTVAFVYTADCPGTCMMTVSKSDASTAAEARDAIAESWGNGDNLIKSESPLMDTGKDGYWLIQPLEEGGSGLTETVITTTHDNQVFVFDLTTHVGDDEAMNMQISDTMAMIIDSLQFE